MWEPYFSGFQSLSHTNLAFIAMVWIKSRNPANPPSFKQSPVSDRGLGWGRGVQGLWLCESIERCCCCWWFPGLREASSWAVCHCWVSDLGWSVATAGWRSGSRWTETDTRPATLTPSMSAVRSVLLFLLYADCYPGPVFLSRDLGLRNF